MKKNHALARKLVQDALDRFTAPVREEHEGDAQLIVLGAILEEVGNGRPNNSGVTIHVGAKTITALGTVVGGGLAALWALAG